MSTSYGNFHDFCRDSTFPACNLFQQFKALPSGQIGGYAEPPRGCELRGIPLSGDRLLQNLGVILLCGIAILVSLFLLFRSQGKKAAVGRREIQIFLIGYILIEICEIFSVGGFPLRESVRIGFSGVHIGLITAVTWILMLNGAVGFQLVDDGTIVSMALMVGSAALIFIGTGYIALDIGYGWTDFFQDPVVQQAPNRSYGLYTLYFLAPAVFLFVYTALETFLVLKVLREVKPLLWLGLAVLFFAAGQVFDFVISVHICNGTDGKIDGSLFETFFTLLAVVMIWVFWSSITEDDWPTEQEASTTTYE